MQNLFRSSEGAARGWCRSSHGRNHFRHAQRQGCVVRHHRCLGTNRPQCAVDNFGHRDRQIRKELERPNRGSVPHFNRARATPRSGLNCSLGPDEMEPFIEELSRTAPFYVRAYPNAGLPDPLSPTGFPETPESFAPKVAVWLENGWLNLVGGCCGTTPEHIRVIAHAVRDYKPRVVEPR